MNDARMNEHPGRAENAQDVQNAATPPSLRNRAENAQNTPALLSLRNLSVDFNGLKAVDRVDLRVAPGEVLGIVGESGSGKSVMMMALMGLIDAPGKVSADEIRFDGRDLLNASARARRRIIGNEIAMVFQDALTSLNPSYTVGYQIGEVLKLHEKLRGAALKRRALELLDQVGIPDAKNRIDSYPHQLSGGMNQRVMIAMAIACNPKLLIADEPTTALDVTIQAQIMDLLVHLQKARGMALVLISHDLAVVSEVAQRVAVMYAGQIIETNRVPDIFARPHHPYTEALLAAIPEHNTGALRLAALPGMVPGRDDRPPGCLFAPRCAYAREACAQKRPELAWVADEAGDAGGVKNDMGDADGVADTGDVGAGAAGAAGAASAVDAESAANTENAADAENVAGAGSTANAGNSASVPAGAGSPASMGSAASTGDAASAENTATAGTENAAGAQSAGSVASAGRAENAGSTANAGNPANVPTGAGSPASTGSAASMGDAASAENAAGVGSAESAPSAARTHAPSANALRAQGHGQVRCIAPLNLTAPTPTAGETR